MFPAIRLIGRKSVDPSRSLFSVAPPMHRPDIVRMIVSPRSTHSLRTFVIWHDVVAIGKFLVADRANASLLPDLAVHQLPHLGR